MRKVNQTQLRSAYVYTTMMKENRARFSFVSNRTSEKKQVHFCHHIIMCECRNQQDLGGKNVSIAYAVTSSGKIETKHNHT